MIKSTEDNFIAQVHEILMELPLHENEGFAAGRFKKVKE